MYTVTGMVICCATRLGQNQMMSPTQTTTRTAAPAVAAGVRRASGSRAARKHRCAIRNEPSPNTNPMGQPGTASRKSPPAENTSAATSQLRSRMIGWPAAMAASSSAGSALTAGCRANWPVRSAPDGNRSAVTMRKTP